MECPDHQDLRAFRGCQDHGVRGDLRAFLATSTLAALEHRWVPPRPPPRLYQSSTFREPKQLINMIRLSKCLVGQLEEVSINGPKSGDHVGQVSLAKSSGRTSWRETASTGSRARLHDNSNKPKDKHSSCGISRRRAMWREYNRRIGINEFRCIL